MAVSIKRNGSDDDSLEVGTDATATFDNSPSNPTEHASSEHLDDLDTDEDELEDEDFEEGEEDEDDEYEDDDEDDEDDDEYEDDDEDEEDDDDDDEEGDLTKGPKAPSVYRKM